MTVLQSEVVMLQVAQACMQGRCVEITRHIEIREPLVLQHDRGPKLTCLSPSHHSKKLPRPPDCVRQPHKAASPLAIPAPMLMQGEVEETPYHM